MACPSSISSIWSLSLRFWCLSLSPFFFFPHIFLHPFSLFAFLLISPSSYKTSDIGFCPSSSLFCFQVELHSSPPGALGGLKRGYKSIMRRRHPSLPHGILYNFLSIIPTFLGNQKIAGKSSHDIRVELWAFVNEDGMCPVLLTEKSSVKNTGSSIQSAPTEELLQNNEQQQVLLEAEVGRTLLQIASRLQLVNAKGYKRPVKKLAWWHQLKRISETCQGLNSWHHILGFASKSSWAHHLGTHTLMLCSTWVWRWRMKSMGEWGNTLWCQADRFSNWKSFGLYSAFELWLISEEALHAPVCRMFGRSVPLDRHGHFAQLPSTYWALQHLVMVYSYLCPCRQFSGFLERV